MNTTWFKKRRKCPACDSDKFRPIYKIKYNKGPIKDYLKDFYDPQGMVEFEYLDGANYILCECDLCGLLFQKDIPNDFLTKRLYEQWIDPQKVFNLQQKQHDLGHFSNYAQEIMQIIAYFRTKPSSLCFLDFGMGWGKWALMAKAFGCDSYGNELSLERIEYAKKNGIKIVEWKEIPQHCFDFINTEQVFEHIPEPLHTLRHLKKALKDQGIIKISVPGCHDIKRRLKIMDWKAPKGSKNSLNPVSPLEHINCFRRSAIVKMASRAKMEEVFIPAIVQYKHITNWSSPSKIAKNLYRPIYLNFHKKKNYIFLRNIQERKN